MQGWPGVEGLLGSESQPLGTSPGKGGASQYSLSHLQEKFWVHSYLRFRVLAGQSQSSQSEGSGEIAQW